MNRHLVFCRLMACLGTALLASAGTTVRAGSGPNPNHLPVYTSPIDVTGLKLQLHMTVPDRESGRPVDIALPAGLIGPKFNQLLSTPLSTQIDEHWNSAVDPRTGMTARQAACDGPGGIKEQVVKEVAKRGSSYSAYDVSCTLASKGQMLVKQAGSTLEFAYLLTNNSVSFASTSPGTCRAGSGTPLCPNDPRFTVRFATEITTVVRTPSICQMTAENGAVYVVSANFEAHNAAADVAKFFAGQKFVAAEVAITNTVRSQPLPLDAALKELRTSDACTGRAPGLSRVLMAFRDPDTSIDMRQGIILRATHVGIAAPVLDAPNPGGAAATQSPRVPSFTRPMLSTSQPLVTAGGAVRARGQHFPLNINLATALPLTLQHGGYGGNSIILGGGVCLGGATEIEWGPAGGPLLVEKLVGNPQGQCAATFNASKLAPNTAYQFRARDCDLITCSPRSAMLKVTTAKLDPANSAVRITLDGGIPLGTATVDALGTFDSDVTIPAATAAGAHMIHAVNGAASADVVLQVMPPAGAGGTRKASIMMVALLRGETGCPNHPINSTQTDDTFMLFGTGFAPGAVAIYLDTVGGVALGTATVRPDGSICQKMRSASGSQAGAHRLVAAQQGVAAAQAAVMFTLPSGIR